MIVLNYEKLMVNSEKKINEYEQKNNEKLNNAKLIEFEIINNEFNNFFSELSNLM